MCKNIFLADLSGSQYLFEILLTSLTFRNGENVLKENVSKSVCNGERKFFFEMKEEYKNLVEKYWYFAKLLGGWYLFEI